MRLLKYGITYFLLALILMISAFISLTHAQTRRQGSATRGRRRSSAGSATTKTNRLTPFVAVAVRDALKGLHTLVSATDVGVTYDEYRSRLIEAKTVVDEANSVLPDGDLKREMTAAITAYMDMGKLWQKYITFQTTDNLFQMQREMALNGIKFKTGMSIAAKEEAMAKVEASLKFLRYSPQDQEVASIVEMYSILHSAYNDGSQAIWFKDFLLIWNIARRHVDKASQLFRQ